MSPALTALTPAQDHVAPLLLVLTIWEGIWEGTTDVLAADFLRALKHPSGGREPVEALDVLFNNAGGGWPGQKTDGGGGGWQPRESWDVLKKMLARDSQEDLVGDARQILWTVAEGLVAVLLYADARRDDDQAAWDVLSRWRLSFGGKPFHEAKETADMGKTQGNGKDRLASNFAIVYSQPGLDAPLSRL